MKSIGMRNYLLWLAMSVLVFVSCVKEEDEYLPGHSTKIGYAASVGFEKGDAKTKSGGINIHTREVEISQLDKTSGGQNLYLHTIVEDRNIGKQIETKGSILNSSSLTGREMGVSAWVYPSGGIYEEGKSYFLNDELEVTSGIIGSDRYWPGKDDGLNLRFYAYAPSDAQTGEKSDGVATYVSHSADWADGIPSIEYVVPSNVSEQSDLLVASSDVLSSNFGNTAHLEYGHALTAVQFQVDGLYQFKIFKIKISGVRNSGTYKYEYNNSGDNGDGDSETTDDYDAGKWNTDGSGTDGEYILDYGVDGYVCNGQSETIVNDGDGVLFLMPQTLPAGAQIIVEGYDDYTDIDVILTASIAGNVWGKGQNVIYKISLTDIDVQYVLDVKGKEVSAPFYGELNRNFSVLSYKIIHKMGDQFPTYKNVEWRIEESNTYPEEQAFKQSGGEIVKTSFWIDEFSSKTGGGSYIDDATEPTWSNFNFTDSNNGNYGVVAVEPESPVDKSLKPVPNEDPSHAWLGGYINGNPIRQDKGSVSAAFDLSLNKQVTNGEDKREAVGRHTANCYIVNAPGYYKLPLVYGNAILNGAYNVNAYTSAKDDFTARAADGTTTLGATILKGFENFNGVGILEPWIRDDVNKPYDNDISAGIVWQDEPCLVTEVSVVGDYLYFRVRRDCICEGNAVLAIEGVDSKGNTSVIWSWHIWVTEGRNVYDNYQGVVTFNPEEDNGKLRMVYNRIALDGTKNNGNTFLTRRFNLMDVHIGQCDGEYKVYPERSGGIVFSQYEDGVKVGSPVVLEVNQSGKLNPESVPDNAVYYQYGRKDPMLPMYENNSGTVVCKSFYLDDRTPGVYGNNGVGKSVEPASALSEGIKNPGIYYVSNGHDYAADGKQLYHWLSTYPAQNYVNLWNSGSNVLPMFNYTTETKPDEFFKNFGALVDLDSDGKYNRNLGVGMTKTIYDPCPPGYEIPRVDAFTGFTYDGMKRSQSEDGNGVNLAIEYGDFSSYNGYSFFGYPMKVINSADEMLNTTETTIFIQALGLLKYPMDGTPLYPLTKYKVYGSALTSAPICVRWAIDGKTDYQFELARFFYAYGPSSSTFRPISSSSFHLAFPVMPVKTGMNPDPEYYKLYSDPKTVEY